MASRRTEATRAHARDLARPVLPRPLSLSGPFVGREQQLERMHHAWQAAAAGRSRGLLVAGEPGVGKTRLSAECARRAHDAGALVLYGSCDEELSVPLDSFVEAVRPLVPALGAGRLRGVRGVEKLAHLVSELAEVLPSPEAAFHADADTERLAMFDAFTALLVSASMEAPVLLVLDDLHWAGRTTLTLLRHVLRNAHDARLLVVGTYRDTELGRLHPLAHTLADLRSDDVADRIALSGLPPDDVVAYLGAVGNGDEALGRELAEVTAGNPYFVIETLRHVEETGGTWQRGNLPDRVREAVRLRLLNLSKACNDALSVAAVAGTTFDLALVERVRGAEQLDEIEEAVTAGLAIEEPGTNTRFRFAHALVRQVLLDELLTSQRVRVHRTIAEILEADDAAADRDEHLAELAYHWFECAVAGHAAKAVVACRRAADRALARFAYEEAADLFAMAIQAAELRDDVDHDHLAELHRARCDALLTAGDVGSARAAIAELSAAAQGSERLQAWHAVYTGQLEVLAEPDHLDDIIGSISAAAALMRAIDDVDGEANAHFVHALALERLGQLGAAERALGDALAAARAVGDRRLTDSILAEVPPAALWGPSPVSRAGGSCLDIWRLLRLTADAPAVESVAVRCVAVIEALRGNMGTARRMIGAARATVERLGLAHRRLEAQVSAGFIELLDGKAAAAERILREAYAELRARGLDGEAAYAAALAARAQLALGRVDEADALAAEAEALAGSDLQAAITWRAVRAETAARRGQHAPALELARSAVDLASTTDALVLVGDGHRALAAVLRAHGDVPGAHAEAERAVEAYSAKGASALVTATETEMGTSAAGIDGVAVARRGRAANRHADEGDLDAAFALYVKEHGQGLGDGDPEAAGHGVDAAWSPFENDSVRGNRRCDDAWNRGDWQGMLAELSPEYRVDDRRPLVGEPLDGADAIENLRLVFEAGATYGSAGLLATRGDRYHLGRRSLSIGGEVVAVWLAAIEVDDRGRKELSVMLNDEDVEVGHDELDNMYATGEGAAYADVRSAIETYRQVCSGEAPSLALDAILTDDFTLVLPDAKQEDRAAFVARRAVTQHHALQLNHLRLSPSAGLLGLGPTDKTADASATGLPTLVVFRYVAGRFQRFEPFDDGAAAMDRYEELVRAGTTA